MPARSSARRPRDSRTAETCYLAAGLLPNRSPTYPLCARTAGKPAPFDRTGAQHSRDALCSWQRTRASRRAGSEPHSCSRARKASTFSWLRVSGSSQPGRDLGSRVVAASRRFRQPAEAVSASIRWLRRVGGWVVIGGLLVLGCLQPRQGHPLWVGGYGRGHGESPARESAGSARGALSSGAIQRRTAAVIRRSTV